MTEEPMTPPDAAVPPDQIAAGPSTEVVVPARRPVVLATRRWPDLAVRARRQLEVLRQNPAAMVAVSAAATVGSALVTAGLRRALGEAALPAAGRTASVAVRGYFVHEVHVVHHVVHHVIGPPAE